MLVSAISVSDNIVNFALPQNNVSQKDADPSSNSFTSSSSKMSSEESVYKLFENINEWQHFCHAQISGKKLDVIV